MVQMAQRTRNEDVITSAPTLGSNRKADSTISQVDKLDGVEEPQPGWLHWHEPGTSKEEKRLLFKLDWFLLSFSCLTYFIKQVRPFRFAGNPKLIPSLTILPA